MTGSETPPPPPFTPPERIVKAVLEALPPGPLKELFKDIDDGYRDDAVFKARIITERLSQ